MQGLPSLPVSLEGTVITGGPIGTDEFVAAFVKDLVEKEKKEQYTKARAGHAAVRSRASHAATAHEHART